MSSVPTLDGIDSKMVETSRIKTHVLFSGPADGAPVLFLHGNASSATFWEEIMLMLPEGYRGLAPDLRGYGDTEDKVIDAERGMGDWIDDLADLLDTLAVQKFHLIGHSMGGTLVFGMVAAHPERVLSATVVNPGSIFGFGGSKGVDGQPCYEDFAGSGGGIVNPDFPRLIGEGDRSSDNPQASPRVVMNSFYWKPPFVPEREEDLLSSLLTEKIGADRYPGDMVPSGNWPNVAPGRFGPINAISPKYVGDSVEKFLAAEPKPFVLWIRGEADQIVSDTSLFDFGTLGQMGLVPGWPGLDVYPPQPMVSQTRYLLESYKAKGGDFEEFVMADTAHTPFVEKPQEFMDIFKKVLA
ncbi:MAG: alpha/beta hydrolase [Anaerolineales bacterium]|nr:alpha/beta hydrolase [Anaerolineales bacterium]